MKRGYSGAVITQCVRGVMKCADKGKGLIQQAELCEQLYPVTPKILNKYVLSGTDAYTMETLSEPPIPSDCTAWACTAVSEMLRLLINRVWSTPKQKEAVWLVSLNHWLKQYPGIGKDLSLLMELFYSDSFLLYYCMTHGDPTLSNCLYRNSGELVIADPIPASGKIPGMAAVDLGKMLQSAMGWETELFGWQYNSDSVTRVIMWNQPLEVQARAWFWAAVHCLRIVPYATEGRVIDWCMVKATYAVTKAREYECYMRSILTAHSSTAKTPS